MYVSRRLFSTPQYVAALGEGQADSEAVKDETTADIATVTATSRASNLEMDDDAKTEKSHGGGADDEGE